MNKLLLITLMTAGFTGYASASDYTDYATVKKVEPQYSRVNQATQKCQVETVQETIPGRQNKSYGGAVIGGVAGGLVGNQVGGGHGREAATALGAVVGALTGDNLDNRNNYVPSQTTTRDVQRCYNQDNYVQQITNYKVTYEYKGRTDTFMSPVAPRDNKVRVTISVNPVIDSYAPTRNDLYGNDRNDDRNDRGTRYTTPSYEAPYPAYVR